MNKSTLIKLLSKKHKMSQKDVDFFISIFLEEVLHHLENQQEINLSGFGCFHVRKHKAVTRPHPKTKEVMNLPERLVPHFRFGVTARNRIKKNL